MAYISDYTQGCRQLRSAEAENLIRDSGAIVVDVREFGEYAFGRIPDAKHIPLKQLGHRMEDLESHRQQPIILSCRSGNRSEMACRFLRESGFENVYNLAGGITAWRQEKLSVEN